MKDPKGRNVKAEPLRVWPLLSISTQMPGYQ